MSEPSANNAVHIVLLVHGTGDAALLPDDRRRWWQSKSTFVERLKARLDSVSEKIKEDAGLGDARAVTPVSANTFLVPFVWSGDNEKRARHTAAAKFAIVLKMLSTMNFSQSERKEDLPASKDAATLERLGVELPHDLRSRMGPKGKNAPRISVIAHSHGGNVVYEAFYQIASIGSGQKTVWVTSKGYDGKAPESHLDKSDAERVSSKLNRWITLGTPFLLLRQKRSWAVTLTRALKFLALLVLPFAAIATDAGRAAVSAGWDIIKNGNEAISTLIVDGPLRSLDLDATLASVAAFPLLLTVIALAFGAYRFWMFNRRKGERREREAFLRRIGETKRRSIFGKKQHHLLVPDSKAVPDVQDADQRKEVQVNPTFSEEMALEFHKRFGGKLRNFYSVQDEAVAALTRFDEERLEAVSWRRDQAIRKRMRRVAKVMAVGILVIGFVHMANIWDAARGGDDPTGRVAVWFLGFVGLSWLIYDCLPRIVAAISRRFNQVFWRFARKAGLGDDDSAGHIKSAAASPNRFKGIGERAGSVGRLSDLRDHSLPAEVEGQLRERAFSRKHDDDWRDADLLSASELLDDQDSFLQFLVRQLGTFPLIHNAYFKSEKLIEMIAYALLRESDPRQESGEEDGLPIERLREHENRGTQTSLGGVDGRAERAEDGGPMKRTA